MKIKVTHYRLPTEEPNDACIVIGTMHELRGAGLEPAPYGGYTEAVVYDGDRVVAKADARCSRKDQFNRRIGRDIAVGRATKQMGGDK